VPERDRTLYHHRLRQLYRQRHPLGGGPDGIGCGASAGEL